MTAPQPAIAPVLPRSADYNVGHAASQPVPEDIVVPRAAVYGDPDFATRKPWLNGREAAFFKARGYIVKRGLIDGLETFRRIVDQIWRNVPRGLLRRDDPDTWTDAPDAEWTEEDALRVGLLAGGNWKMRSREGIGTEDFLVEAIANHPAMRTLAEAFIGGPVKRVERVRGIYCVFPAAPGAAAQYRPHADNAAAHLSAMVIADTLPPDTGGFTVWPGSHRRLHMHWDTVHGGVISQDKRESYRLARDAILADTAPVEFTGVAGDVVFWHPRLLHSAGINRSADGGVPRVRVIVPCDYERADRSHFDDMEFGPGARYQWWIDTRNFREDVAPSEDNMWRDWAI
ncbi:MAG: phytanoyl-CoA dioxygenase family protein [bacterium]|nr:phytanoyl-CoA dioxygenase family protein [bacterium]MDE0241553.1 phytanoyl-CoA dioxygenase family protein [bacterium]